MKSLRLAAAALCVWASLPVAPADAQSVTTGSITGVVTDTNQKPVPGASVIAIHEPSGTSYEATTEKEGRYTIPNMRIGGPYTVTVNYVGTGTAFAPKTVENLEVNLGTATDVNVTVEAINVTEKVVVVG